MKKYNLSEYMGKQRSVYGREEYESESKYKLYMRRSSRRRVKILTPSINRFFRFLFS